MNIIETIQLSEDIPMGMKAGRNKGSVKKPVQKES